MDWGTTPQHKAAVVSGGVTSTGSVWLRSSWLSASGSSDLWRNEALRCKRDYDASFARVDRSQSSELDRLRAAGFLNAESGIAKVDVRIGEFQGLVIRKAVFIDSSGPGCVELYNHLCAYHRDRDGVIVEEEDDDIDAALYLVNELVRPVSDYSTWSTGNTPRQGEVPRARSTAV